MSLLKRFVPVPGNSNFLAVSVEQGCKEFLKLPIVIRKENCLIGIA